MPARTEKLMKGDRVMKITKLLLSFGVILVLMVLNGRLNAQSGPRQFVPFRDFVAVTTAAQAGDYLGQPASRVQDAASFEEMRHHILTLYEGVEVTHSFILDSDHIDCVPIEQQPSVRILGIKHIASPPPLSTLPPSGGDDEVEETAAYSATQLDPERPFDEFGNSVVCEAKTIPMRRLTLEEMTRFPTLREFFQKGPDGAGQAIEPEQATPLVTATHKYSYTYQNVNNLGGNAALNVWSPYVKTSSGEIFSLSQEWYVGGSGTGFQTAEVGWQNCPAKYGNENSRLFIFWTPNNYNTAGPGCYNLDCAAFVQTADKGILGGAFSNYSTVGGTQYDFTAQYKLYQGNWWLFYQGTAIGYYPGSLYKGGQLTKHATTIEFGTESVGTTVWPPEGSGNWSSTGFGKAAYQRDLFYINTSSTSVWDTLKASDPSPKCYSISGPYYSTSSGWGWYFYEGGPGGSGC
jgi:hypothetical protein